MQATINMGKRPEWGGFNMSLLALQVAPEEWWSAYLWALHMDGFGLASEKMPSGAASL